MTTPPNKKGRIAAERGAEPATTPLVEQARMKTIEEKAPLKPNAFRKFRGKEMVTRCEIELGL